MSNRNLISPVLFLGMAAALLSFDLPGGWFRAGSKPQRDELGTYKGAGQVGKDAGRVLIL
jgi:hypothetical protein